MTTSSLPFLAFLSSFAFMSVTAAPNRSTQDLIGPENFKEEMISSATTCQTAILRCCTPDTPTTNATWRCFEKNSCGGLFVVHDKNDTDRNNIDLGACAFLSQVKELVDEEDNTESTDVNVDEEENTDSTDSTDVSVRNEGNPFAEEQDDLANTHKEESSSESNEDLSKEKIFRNQPKPTNRLPFESKGCHGGTHEKCIEDKEGCGALEQINLENYVKCVHHCVEHCKGGR